MTKEFTHSALKVHGKKSEDLEIISSHIQDAHVLSSSFSYNSEDQTFVLLGNRFCWEHFLHPENPIKMRVHSGIHFDHVKNVHKKNIKLHHPSHVHNLLRLHEEEGCIYLTFSDQEAIRLEVGEISCKIADLHEPYPTLHAPDHHSGK